MQPEDVKRAIVEANAAAKRRQSIGAVIGLLFIIVAAVVGAWLLLPYFGR